MLQDDVADGDEERVPVLVQRDHADHDEVVEVHLDHPAGEVHEHRRRREQAEGREDGRLATLGPHDPRGDGEGAHGAGLDEPVKRVLAADDGEEEHHRHVDPEQVQDPPVALGPDLGGEGGALGEQVTGALQERRGDGHSA